MIIQKIQTRLGLLALLSLLVPLLMSGSVAKTATTNDNVSERSRDQFPFQNFKLPIEERIKNILSLMTLDEKIGCLGTNPSVPRLGIRGSGHVEGIHGLAQGGPAKWGRPATIPTTTFPQGIGLGETWDPDIVRQAAAVEGY